MLPTLFFYAGVCYVTNGIVLNPYLEHWRCENFMNLTLNPSKWEILLEDTPWTNKIYFWMILFNFDCWGAQTAHVSTHVWESHLPKAGLIGLWLGKFYKIDFMSMTALPHGLFVPYLGRSPIKFEHTSRKQEFI